MWFGAEAAAPFVWCVSEKIMPVRVVLLGEPSAAVGERIASLPAALDLCVTGSYVDGASSRHALLNTAPDVAVVSASLQDGSGFDLIASLAPADRPAAIVFLSSREGDAVRAFELHVTDFVPLPLNPSRLREAMIRARHQVLQAALLRTADELQRLLGEVVSVEELGGMSTARPRRPSEAAERDAERLAKRASAGIGVREAGFESSWQSRGGVAVAPERTKRETEETVLDLSAVPHGATAGTDGAGGRPLRVLVREGRRTRFVPLSEVDWFEADGNYIVVHAGDQTYRTRGTISAIEAVLDPRQFVRIHRRLVVNMDRVREMSPLPGGDGLLMLGDGSTLRLSRTYRTRIR